MQIWKRKNDLDNILRNQKYVNDKSGLGAFKIKNSSQIKKVIFVKSNITCNNVQFRKICHNVHPRKI